MKINKLKYKFCSMIKIFFHNKKIQYKLFISSIALASFVAVSIFLFSQIYVNSLFINQQADHEINSFKQVSKYFKTLTEGMEGYFQQINIDKVISQILTQKYDNMYQTIYDNESLINSELSNIFPYKDYIDNIILLGKNNSQFVYSYNSTGFYYLGEDFDFSLFIKKSNLASYFDKTDAPVFYSLDNNINQYNNIDKQLYSLIDKKIVYIRALKNDNNQLDGVVIITIKSDVISNIFPDIPKDQSIFMTDKKNTLIWASNPENSQLLPLLPSSQNSSTGHFKKEINSEKYLFSFSSLSPYEFNIISQIPLNSILKINGKVRIYIFLYSMICLLFVLVVAFIFSSIISNPLRSLTDKLSEDISSLVDNNNKTIAPLLDMNLKNKILFYFFITVIIPTALYITCLTYLNYRGYQDKITELTLSTVKQAKWNMDYKFKDYESMTKQLATSDSIQDAMNLVLSQQNTSFEATHIEKDFLNAKMSYKEFLTMNLYNRLGNNLYSGIYSSRYADTSSFLNPQTMKQQKYRKLTYIPYEKKLFTDPVFIFARSIYSKQNINYNTFLGYSVYFIDQDIFNSIINKIKLGDTGYFFLMNNNGDLLTNDNEELFESFSGKASSLSKIKNTQTGDFTIKLNNHKYLVIYDTSSIFDLKIVGLLPFSEIQSTLSPLVWYSIVALCISLFIILLVSSLISSSITKPIKKLQKLMIEIDHSNFNVSMAYEGKDEIAALSNQFNRMVQRLNELIYENYQSKLRESELMFLEKEAQLNALQQQINPHFLYNTLESIKWMAYKKGAMEICNMANALGKFFRGAITKGNGFVTFSEEIEHLKNYIYIQKIRYQNKFDVLWEIDNEIMSCKTIKLFLQPIVENAIIHGIEASETNGLITIKGCRLDNMLNIEIIDNGVGMNKEQLESFKNLITLSSNEDERTSVGIKNVYRRIKLNFGDEGSFLINSEEGLGTKITITLPVIELSP